MTAKTAVSGLSRVRSFFFFSSFGEKDLRLAEEVTEKPIVGGWENCLA